MGRHIQNIDEKSVRLYQMIHPAQGRRNGIRSVYIVNPDNKIILTMIYPMNTGRSFDETLSVIDALQIADEFGIAAPTDWKVKSRVII